MTVLCVIVSLVCLNHPLTASAVAILYTYSAEVHWNPSPALRISGYRVHYGTTPGNYSQSISVGNVSTATVSGLSPGITYYFAISAYDANGTESASSRPVSFVPGTPVAQIQCAPGGSANITVKGLIGHTYEIQATQDFQTWNTLGAVTLGTTASGVYSDANVFKHTKRFYRTHDLQL